MIHIEQNQAATENPHLKVFSATGDYSDADLIECYDAANPTIVAGAFQAQFIKYGPVVYQYNEPEELGKAIVKIDPASTHDAAILYKEDEERRIKRSRGTLEPENPVPVDEQLSQVAQDSAAEEALLQEAEALVPDAPEVMETPVVETPITPTPPPVVDMSTTTPTSPVPNPDPVATSDFFTSSSTPVEQVADIVVPAEDFILPLEQATDAASSTVPSNP